MLVLILILSALPGCQCLALGRSHADSTLPAWHTDSSAQVANELIRPAGDSASPRSTTDIGDGNLAFDMETRNEKLAIPRIALGVKFAELGCRLLLPLPCLGRDNFLRDLISVEKSKR